MKPVSRNKRQLAEEDKWISINSFEALTKPDRGRDTIKTVGSSSTLIMGLDRILRWNVRGLNVLGLSYLVWRKLA